MVCDNRVVETGMHVGKKMPLDTRIVAYWFFFTALVGFLFGGVLVSGVGQFPSYEERLILFGAFSLVSESSFGIYYLVLGGVSFICAYGLLKGYKLGWWLVLIYCINLIVDSSMAFSQYKITSLVGICVSVAIIVWLIYRRTSYGVGVGAEKVQL